VTTKIRTNCYLENIASGGQQKHVWIETVDGAPAKEIEIKELWIARKIFRGEENCCGRFSSQFPNASHIYGTGCSSFFSNAEPISATIALALLSELTPATPESAQTTTGPASTSYVRITSSLRSKVHALRQYAAWSFRHIADEVGIAVSTVFSICKAPSTSRKIKPEPPKILNSPIRKQLVFLATSSQQNR